MRQHLTIKNRLQETRLFNSRLITAIVLVGLLSLLLMGRLYYLQIQQHKHYQTLSVKNHIDLVPISPKRGLIFDRNHVLLAENIPAFSLTITPSKTENLKNTITQLQTIITLSENDLEQFYKQLKQHRRFDEIPLKVKLTESEVARVTINHYRFPSLAIKASLIRHYPFKDIFSHVVGYVGRINEQEFTEVDSTNYATTNFIGKTGVEKYYENLLHGQVGYQKVETNARGQIIRTLDRIAPKKGQNIYLTIDSRLQIAATKALDDSQGAVVALDPNNGEILALVSKPSFDANLFVIGISQKAYRALQQDNTHPLYNRVLRGLYSPGSTIKPFIALVGLNANLIKPQDSILDTGQYQIPETAHIFHDWKPYGHGYVNLSKAIIKSCDTYFYILGHHLGIHRISDMLNQFGLNDITHIDLPGELPGNVPTPAWKYRMKKLGWYSGDTVLTAIGQGFLQVTPLALAVATATLAKQGLRLQPHLIYAVQSPNAPLMTQTESIPAGFVTLNNTQHWNTVIKAMSKVISYGTGYRFGHVTYPVAAKTGTVQVISLQYDKMQEKLIPVRLRNHSLFIAFTPIKDPKIAIAVIVENNKSAPVVARKILDCFETLTHPKPPETTADTAQANTLTAPNTTTTSAEDEDLI